MSEGAVGGGDGGGGTPAGGVPAGGGAPDAGVLGAIGAVPPVADPVAGGGQNAPEITAPAWAGEGLEADDIAFLANKGLTKDGKTARDLIQIARHQDGIKGIPADQLTRLPDFSKPEDVAEFNAKIGVPDAPDKYEAIEVAIGEGVLDVGILAGMSHKAGLRPDQHAVLAAEIGEWANGEAQSQVEAKQAETEANAQELVKNWGENYEANVAIANKAAVRFDVTNDEFKAMASALGPKRAAEIWHGVGVGMGEHKPAVDAETNNNTGTGLSKDVAIARRTAKMKDSVFFARLQAGDEAARKEWENLNRIASS